MSQKQDPAPTAQHQHQQLPHGHRSSFLPSRHYHDALDNGDDGEDDGAPFESEEGDYDSVDGSFGNEVGGDGKADGTDDSVDGATMDPAPATAIRTRAASLDELYEEVGLHETTLATLHSKLTELTSQIEAEERAAATLRQDILKLTQQKLILKKRTEGGVDLVKRVEGTLEKCLDRLKGVLKRSDVAKSYNDDDEIGDEHHEDAAGSFVRANEASKDEANPYLDSNRAEETMHEYPVSQLDQPVSPQTSNDAVNNKAQDKIACTLTNDATPKVIFTEITLHYENRDTIQWPSTESTDEVERRVKNVFPTWRTNLPSPSLWQNIESINLLTELMNISSLENLLERRHLVEKSLLPADCGWVKESGIVGTTLDVYRHVDCKRWFNDSRQIIPDSQNASQSMDLEESALDPDAILCPYELGGTCADDRCLYQHLGRRPVQSVVTLQKRSKSFLRYYSLPDLRMPPALSKTDFMMGQRHDNDGVISGDRRKNDGKLETVNETVKREQHSRDQRAPHSQAHSLFCQTCAKTFLSDGDFNIHLKQCNPCLLEVDRTPYNVRNALPEESTSNTSDRSHIETIHHEQGFEDLSATHEIFIVDARDITENHDFINLPTVDDSSDEDESSNESLLQDDLEPQRRGFIFHGDFWWQEIMPRLEPELGIECYRIVDMILLSFGFEAVLEHDKGGETETTPPTMLRCSHLCFDKSISGELNETLVIARTIDFCRICIHMGQDSLGFAVLRGVYNSNLNGLNMCLLSYAEDSMKGVSTSRSACDVFTCQMLLLLISEFYRIFYAWQREDKTSWTEPSLEELLNALHDHVDSTNTGPGVMMHHLSSRLPSRAPSSDGVAQSSWDPFVSVLELQLEKHVVLPFYHKMTKKQQFSFLVECAQIGQMLQALVESIRDQTFSPLSHALDPTWSVLQRLLQKSPAQQNLKGINLLRPTVLLILVIGPMIFACVNNTISFPSMRLSTTTTTEGGTSLPKFDSRKRLDLSALDVFIVEMIKALRRYARKATSAVTVEPLLSTLSVLSVAISVSLGEFDKVQLRLENALNSMKKSAHWEAPSINVLSEMLWSQLVHLRMNCPSYHDSSELRSSEITENPALLLHPYIAEVHNEIASRIIENGVILRGLDLCGDRVAISATVCNLTHRRQWQGLVSLSMDRYALKASCKLLTASPTGIEFHISHEVKKPDELSSIEFPLSVLITGQALTHLSIVGCMLDKLPYSIGVHLTGLLSLNVSDNRLHEIPSSISFMTSLQILDVSRNKIEHLPLSIKNCTNLQVIDVSHNKLSTFPGDLALLLPLLQSFIFEGNPGHEAVTTTKGRAQKRKRITRTRMQKSKGR